MLDQAVQDYGKRIGCAILKQRRVGRNAIDVETAFEVVRITQDATTGHISLMGWRKGVVRYERFRHTYELMTGVYFAGSGWRCSLMTVHKTVYGGLKSTLPKGA